MKYWKHNGYAVPIEDLLKVDAVKLYTKYDGNITATKETFDKHAIPHLFEKPNGQTEHQLILPLEYWESF